MLSRPVASKIMVIRHAEKPTEREGGVSPAGRPGKEHLTPRGWQRAGALVPLFSAPAGLEVRNGLAQPLYLFAPKDGSLRSLQTITPLSDRLGIRIAQGVRGNEVELVEAATASDGAVLISWPRELIPEIARLLLAGSPDLTRFPKSWPPECFDVIWIFDLEPDAGYYRFRQMPQRLLAGDSDSVIG